MSGVPDNSTSEKSPAPFVAGERVAILIRCSCDRVYRLREWLALPKPPTGDRQSVADDDSECDHNCTGEHSPFCKARGWTLVLRNCPCRSTMAVDASVADAVVRS
jgi:hypothetical protein